MTFTRALARISSAYRTKHRIALNPEFAFFGPLTDEMEQVLARAFRLSECNETQYRAACHSIIESERAFLMEANDEQLDEVYGDGLWEDDKAILAHYSPTAKPDHAQQSHRRRGRRTLHPFPECPVEGRGCLGQTD